MSDDAAEHDDGAPTPEPAAALQAESVPAGAARGREYLELVLVAAAIGVPAALLAAGFLALVHALEDVLWTDLPSWLGADAPPWYLVVGLPVVGAALVVAARTLLPGDGGHSPLEGLGAAVTPWQHAPGIALAAIGTLAFGAVLGPEAPLIALGSMVGTAVVDWRGLAGPSRKVLATAGSFSAVSALFGGPLVAGILLLEAGLAAGAALVPGLLPGLAAAAVGYVLFVGVDDWNGLGSASLSVPGLPDYQGTRLVDLALALAVGIGASLAIKQVRSIATRLDRTTNGAGRRRAVLATLLGGLAVGVLAQAAQLLGADADQVLFSGQSALPDVLTETSVAVLLVLLVAKGVGYAVCLGCGFRGGPVFPAIFLGVTIATVLCVLLDRSPTWALAVGAAAGMTAGTGMVFSSLLFAMLLAGSDGHDALPAAVLAVIAAWLTNAALQRRTEPLPEAADLRDG